MKAFTLHITAHIGDDCMTIGAREYNGEHPGNILEQLHELAPIISGWRLDDGDDEPDTSYCQYVKHEDGGDYSNYLLAIFCEMSDDETMEL